MSSKSSSASLPSDYTTIHLLRPDEEGSSFGRRKGRFGGAFGTSVGLHVLFIAVFLFLAALPDPPSIAVPERPFDANQLVWLDMQGPGGGGGGGGNQMKEPPRKLETKGPDKLAVPVEKTPPPAPPRELPKETPPEPPKMAMTLPVRPMDAGQMNLPGAVDGSLSAPTLSQGSGSGGGAGTGQGTGSGPGRGSGLGDGYGGGTGGGAYQVGNGVLSPQVLYEAKPQYTAEAMRAKIQGTALVSAVVMPDGTAQNVHIMRSLDSVFGLDQEAVKAVRQWRFRPGTRFGQPVPVQVSIEVSFNLR
jgi:TonB family protein